MNKKEVKEAFDEILHDRKRYVEMLTEFARLNVHNTRDIIGFTSAMKVMIVSITFSTCHGDKKETIRSLDILLRDMKSMVETQ